MKPETAIRTTEKNNPSGSRKGNVQNLLKIIYNHLNNFLSNICKATLHVPFISHFFHKNILPDEVAPSLYILTKVGM